MCMFKIWRYQDGDDLLEQAVHNKNTATESDKLIKETGGMDEEVGNYTINETVLGTPHR